MVSSVKRTNEARLQLAGKKLLVRTKKHRKVCRTLPTPKIRTLLTTAAAAAATSLDDFANATETHSILALAEAQYKNICRVLDKLLLGKHEHQAQCLADGTCDRRCLVSLKTLYGPQLRDRLIEFAPELADFFNPPTNVLCLPHQRPYVRIRCVEGKQQIEASVLAYGYNEYRDTQHLWLFERAKHMESLVARSSNAKQLERANVTASMRMQYLMMAKQIDVDNIKQVELHSCSL